MTPAPAEVPRSRMLRTLRPGAAWLVRRRFDIRLHGVDRIPEGPVILASNHVGIVDGPLLATCSPRPVHALTKSEMFHGRTGRLLESAGQIPVVRHTPDAAAIRAALAVLESGGVLGIYPEGSRDTGRFEIFEDGVAYFALATGAPVVPVSMFGSKMVFQTREELPPRGARIDVAYGAPFQVQAQPWPRTRAQVAAMSAEIRQHLRSALHAAENETGLSLTTQGVA